MVRGIGPDSPEVMVLRHALLKLRGFGGFTEMRLRANPEAAAPFVRLGAVRRYARVHELDEVRAIREVVGQCIEGDMVGEQRVVADVVLGLGRLSPELHAGGLAPGLVRELYAESLGTRREVLLVQWQPILSALDLTPTSTPSDRVLRGDREEAALAVLAQQLHRREKYTVAAKSAPVLDSGAAVPAHGGRAVVVGGAVMDAVFKVREMPSVETSTEAHEFDLILGGKGLTQAVAAARPGLEVSLVAAIGDDNCGDEIVKYLDDRSVDTSLIGAWKEPAPP